MWLRHTYPLNKQLQASYQRAGFAPSAPARPFDGRVGHVSGASATSVLPAGGPPAHRTQAVVGESSEPNARSLRLAELQTPSDQSLRDYAVMAQFGHSGWRAARLATEDSGTMRGTLLLSVAQRDLSPEEHRRHLAGSEAGWLHTVVAAPVSEMVLHPLPTNPAEAAIWRRTGEGRPPPRRYGLRLQGALVRELMLLHPEPLGFEAAASAVGMRVEELSE